jgi:hypothetical protein
MTERDVGAAWQQVSQAGTAAGAAALCDMTEQNAALVLSGYPAQTTGTLIEAIAAAQPQTAGAILRMLSAAKAGAAVSCVALGPSRVAASRDRTSAAAALARRYRRMGRPGLRRHRREARRLVSRITRRRPRGRRCAFGRTSQQANCGVLIEGDLLPVSPRRSRTRK